MTEENALKILFEVLKEQEFFKVGDLLLGYKENVFSVTGWTHSYYLENVSKENALKDLALVKEKFKELIKKSIELSAFVEDKKVEYYLSFDTGKASIGVCKEVDDKIQWL
jgi:hypothetical protein